MTVTEQNQMIEKLDYLMQKLGINDVLDEFDGGEIDLMFTQNYGEDIKGENED